VEFSKSFQLTKNWIDPDIDREEDLANSMGLFLQKVNIIRDYREDLIDGRTFYPEEIW
jgi:farnesyl-diphosphate farnesyltransferase